MRHFACGKKMLAWLCVLVMLLSMLPVSALAGAEEGTSAEETLSAPSETQTEEEAAEEPEATGEDPAEETPGENAEENTEENTEEELPENPGEENAPEENAGESSEEPGAPLLALNAAPEEENNGEDGGLLLGAGQDTEITEVSFAVSLPAAGTAVSKLDGKADEYDPKDITITVPAEAGYEVKVDEVHCVYGDPDNTSRVLTSLEAGNMVMLVFQLHPKEGYVFADTVSVVSTSGGSILSSGKVSGESDFQISWYSFIPASGETIGTVSIASVTAPVPGTKVSNNGDGFTPSPVLSVDETAVYTMGQSYYYIGSTSASGYFTGTYKAGDTFYIMCMLRPKSGYAFSESISKDEVTAPEGITVENVEADSAAIILYLSGKVPAHTHDGITFDQVLSSAGGELESGNYYLTQDITLESTITIAQNAVVKICLNGYSIDCQNNIRCFDVEGSLTLYDCGKTGCIEKACNDTNKPGAVFVKAGGSFTMNGGSIRNCGSSGTGYSKGGGVYVAAGAAFIMNGGSIEGCYVTGSSSSYGGGVYVADSGSFTMNGGSIKNCSSQSGKGGYGGGVYVDGGSFTMNGGSITECSSMASNGGGVYVAGGTFTLGGSAGIVNNTGTAGSKYARTTVNDNIYLADGATITVKEDFTGKVGVTMQDSSDPITGTCDAAMLNCFFSDDSSKHVEYDSENQVLILADGHVHDNITFDKVLSSDGGELESGNYYLTQDVKLTNNIVVKAGKVVNICLNGYTLTGKGSGSVIKNSGKLTIYDCSTTGSGTITGGRSSTGGGIYTDGHLELKGGCISDCHQSNNSTAYNEKGGGVYVAGGSFTMSGGSIKNCSVYGNHMSGGGVYVADGSFSMSGGSIENCIAGGSGHNNGGGVYVAGGSFSMSGGSITACNARAASYAKGGGVYVAAGGSFSMSGGSITGCYADEDGDEEGGGVYVENKGTFTLGGTAQIINNTGYVETKTDNIYLAAGNTITVQDGYTGKAGVTLAGGTGAFTGSNTADFSSCFSSDNSAYAVSCGTENVLSLLPPGPEASDFSFTAPENLVCDGTEKEASFSSSLSGIGALSIKYYDSTGKLLSGKPSDAGTYTVKLDVAGGTDYAGVKDLSDPSWTFTIGKGTLTADNFGLLTTGSIYTGQKLSATVEPASGISGVGDISISYYSDKDCTKPAEPIDAGVYYVGITVAEGSNYKAITEILHKESWNYTISQRQLSVTGSKADGKTYDGTCDTKATIGTVSGIVSGDDVEVVIKSATFADKNAENGKAVTITYELTGSRKANYAAPDDSETTADIEKRVVNLWSETTSKVYDGTALTASAVYKNAGKEEVDRVFLSEVESLTATGSVTNVAEGTVTNRISYSFKKGCSENNYSIKKEEGKLSITQKKLELRIVNQAKNFGEKDPEWTLMPYTLIEGNTIAYTLGREAGEDVGKYDIIATYAASQGNYYVSIDSGELTISPSDQLTISVTDYSGNYDGKEHSAGVIPSVTEDTVLSYSINNGQTWIAEEPTITDAGSVDVLVKAENPNYETANASYKLTVTPAALMVTAENGQSKDYDGKTATDIHYTAAGQMEGETPAFSGSLALAGGASDAGTYAIIVNDLALKDNGDFKAANYELTFTGGVLYKINKKQLTVTPKSGQSKTYDGKTASDILYTVSGEAKGEISVFTGEPELAGQATKAGTYKIVQGSFAMKDSGAFRTSNYTLEFISDVDYEIKAKELSGCTTEAFSLSFIETGRKLTPKPVVKDGDKTLTEGEDYTLSYLENEEAGTATITIQGRGNYSGTTTVTFDIAALEEVIELIGLADYTEKMAGEDAVLTLGEGTVLKLSDLKRVLVDGTELGSDAYKAEDGCIRITLYKSYLNTLKAGKYVLTVELGGEYEGMKYEKEFTVLAAQTAPAEKQTPYTGDSAVPGLWMLLAGVSALTVGLLLTRKRRKN